MLTRCVTRSDVTAQSPRCPSRSPISVLAMPELPDVTVYVEALRQRILGAKLESTRITHPFLLRTFEPPLASLYGRRVVDLRRVGKREAIGFEGEHWLMLHLMIAGSLHWFAAGATNSGRVGDPRVAVRGVSQAPACRKSHSEAIPHGPANLQRHRQRLLRRNSAPCPPVTHRIDAEARRAVREASV